MNFHRKVTRSFFGRFLASWAQIPASQACLLSFLSLCQLFQLFEPSFELSPLHWLVSFWFELLVLKHPIWWPADFTPKSGSKVESFKGSSILCLKLIWMHMKALKPIFERKAWRLQGPSSFVYFCSVKIFLVARKCWNSVKLYKKALSLCCELVLSSRSSICVPELVGKAQSSTILLW